MFTPNIHYLFFLSWNPHIFFHMQIRLHLMLSPRRFYAGATDWVEDILLMERFFFFSSTYILRHPEKLPNICICCIGLGDVKISSVCFWQARAENRFLRCTRAGLQWWAVISLWGVKKTTSHVYMNTEAPTPQKTLCYWFSCLFTLPKSFIHYWQKG